MEIKPDNVKSAIKNLNNWKRGITGGTWVTAIAALEKQMPKKVVSLNGLNETRCPCCDGVFGYSLELDEYTGEKFYYCYNCGQRLEWK